MRIVQRVTAATAQETQGNYLSVRFGNVLGSRGSVLTAFRSQIDSSGPVTVTHPDVTRYLMTVEEAVELVIRAGAIGRDGEALVLDRGAPVRIPAVAGQLAGSATQPVDIIFTRLRPGEKPHETALGAGAPGDRPIHPLISQVRVPALPEQATGPVAAADCLDAQRSALVRLSEAEPSSSSR